MPVSLRGNSYQATVNHPSLPGGRLRKAFGTQTEAEAWELRARAALKEGRSPALLVAMAEGLPATLAALCRKVEVEHWGDMPGSKSQIGNAKSVVALIGGAVSPADVNEAVIDVLVSRLKEAGNSNATINRKLAALSKMLSVYHKRTGTQRPEFPRLKEGKHRVRYINESEEERVLTFCRGTGVQAFHDFVVLGMDTGLRTRREQLSLDDSNVQRQGGAPVAVIVHPDHSKNGDPRVVPLTARAAEIVARREGRMFHDLTYPQLLDLWGRMKTALGLEADEQFTPYVLRHTFCSRLVQRGVHLVTVKELAGHKNIQVTMRYSHLSPHNYTDAIRKLESNGTTAATG